MRQNRMTEIDFAQCLPAVIQCEFLQRKRKFAVGKTDRCKNYQASRQCRVLGLEGSQGEGRLVHARKARKLSPRIL